MTSQGVFELSLGDGCAWDLVAPSPIQPWLGELARIMELDPARGGAADRRIEFVVRVPAGPQTLDDRADREGWRSFALGTALRVWWNDAVTRAVVEVDPVLLDHPEIRVIAMWTALRPIQFHAISTGGGPFHATLARCGDQGVLIAAAAGIGKSTCYRRLQPPWVGLCDDYSLVVRHRSGEYVAHPFPTFSEYLNGEPVRTWPSGSSIPVRGVFFLERGATDEIEPRTAGDAATLLFDAQNQLMKTLWSWMDDRIVQDLRTRLFENACAMAAAVPSYRLRATLAGRFWEQIEDVLRAAPQ